MLKEKLIIWYNNFKELKRKGKELRDYFKVELVLIGIDLDSNMAKNLLIDLEALKLDKEGNKVLIHQLHNSELQVHKQLVRLEKKIPRPVHQELLVVFQSVRLSEPAQWPWNSFSMRNLMKLNLLELYSCCAWRSKKRLKKAEDISIVLKTLFFKTTILMQLTALK